VADPQRFHTPKSAYTKADLLESGRGGYFGPGNAQLPAPPMLMMDRITEISLDGGDFSKGHVVGELDITPDLWFFDCHFRGDPVMPGCLGLDAMWQIVGFWLGWSGSPGKGRALGVGEVRFRGDITPQIALLRYEVSLRQVRRGKLVLGLANGRLLADGACVYVATDLKVGLVAPSGQLQPSTAPYVAITNAASSALASRSSKEA
jgi:3-hydroxyacyl-[acyl-carrier protein] dehydratase/trans-2-decenoyl-[acyl-carrier protein] isomerase